MNLITFAGVHADEVDSLLSAKKGEWVSSNPRSRV